MVEIITKLMNKVSCRFTGCPTYEPCVLQEKHTGHRYLTALTRADIRKMFYSSRLIGMVGWYHFVVLRNKAPEHFTKLNLTPIQTIVTIVETILNYLKKKKFSMNTHLQFEKFITTFLRVNFESDTLIDIFETSLRAFWIENPMCDEDKEKAVGLSYMFA
jgi:hypothetical protein